MFAMSCLTGCLAQQAPMGHKAEFLQPQIYNLDHRLQMLLDSFDHYNSNLDFASGFQKTQPVVGIFTSPIFFNRMRTDTFDYPHFTWASNVNFVHYAGSWSVPVRWDLSDEDLYALLDSINGVFFAGGATELIDMETGEMSPFYKTAKRVWDYMKRQKDEKGIDWPIFGICQGFEVIHYLANEDEKNTLSNVVLYKTSRPINIKVPDLKNNFELFSAFP